MRNRIWQTYRPGQCEDWNITHEYANAARDAVRYLAELEGLKPDTRVYDMLDPQPQERSTMPAQVQKASLTQKFGNRAKEAAAKAAKAPVRYGQQRLPGGIQHGIARLTECYLGVYDKNTNQKQLDGSSAAGQLYLRMVGVVVEPKTHVYEGQIVATEGLQTSQIIPICDKGASYRGQAHSFESLVAEASNELRAIAGEDFDTSDMDKAIKDIEKAKPLFKFTTTVSQGKGINPATKKPYEPRVWENWLGSKGLVYNPEPTDNSVHDGTEPEFNADSADGAGADGAGADEPSEDDGSEDLDALAEAADKDPEGEAAKRLGELALEIGLTEEDIGNAGESWNDVVALMRERGGEPEPAEEPKDWDKGDTCLYVPPVKGPGGMRPGKKTVECKITAISKDKTSVDLLCGKISYKGVAYDSITRPE